MLRADPLQVRRRPEPHSGHLASTARATRRAAMHRGARPHGTGTPRRPHAPSACPLRGCAGPELEPPAPERAYLQLVIMRWFVAVHAAGAIRPADLAVHEGALARLEDLDVVGSGEPAG